MLRVFLVLVCTTVVTSSYPTDSPISESPNIVLTAPEDEDSIDTLDISDNLVQDEDCEPEEASSVPVKKTEGGDELSPARRRMCSNRVFVRLGRGNGLEVARDLDSEEDMFSRLERGQDKFIRFGRGGRSNDNFIRFGRGGKQDNFIRFGRDRSDNFIRFGRGRTDNFIRFGRERPDNFIRFGRGKSNSFLRLGRAKPDNFIRFGRGKSDNFIRFGRGSNFVRFGRDETAGLENAAVQPEDDSSSYNNARVGRGGKSDSNFIRFGRASGSNFIRLGRANEEPAPREERARNNGNFVRFGRSGNNNDLRRGKLTDRNFIRFGRSGQHAIQYEDEDNRDDNEENAVRAIRLGRSDNPGGGRNFIRLGKRAVDDDLSDNKILSRFGRDIEQIEEMPILSSGDSNQSGKENKTKDEFYHTRTKRSVTISEDEPPEDSSDYPASIANGAYDDDKIQATFDGTQTPFGYYSPLASGIPNYILGPELSVLAPLSNGAESSLSKRPKGDGHNTNYIRLG